jgi:hypothetical protein
MAIQINANYTHQAKQNLRNQRTFYPAFQPKGPSPASPRRWLCGMFYRKVEEVLLLWAVCELALRVQAWAHDSFTFLTLR